MMTFKLILIYFKKLKLLLICKKKMVKNMNNKILSEGTTNTQ